MPEAELRIRLITGEEISTLYEKPETAWSVRRVMMDQVSHGDYVECVKGEIPARDVKAIDFVYRFDDEP